MTFNSILTNKKKNICLSNDAEADKHLSNLHTIFHNFDKAYYKLKEYNSNEASINPQEYYKKSNDVHLSIDSILKNLKDINTLLIKIENLDISDNAIKAKCLKTVEIVNSKIKPRQKELSIIIEEISKKEKDRDSEILSQSCYSDNNSDSSKIDQIQETMISSQEVIINEQLIKERENELKHILKVSAQVKDMTIFMNYSITEQGVKISKYY